MRALLSVWDKTGLVDLARGLRDLGWELVSSGGTARALADAGVAVTEVEGVTGSPEMLGGRVKTLHPRIHGGILADRSRPEHLDDLRAHGIEPIDLVVSNLYPFTTEPSIEMIDIGGPTMVRAAAKNHAHVGIIVDPDDYAPVLDELRRGGRLGDDTRLRLARKAFAHTAAYDAAIASWFDVTEEALPPTLHLALERAQELRYGENPHQQGARYRRIGGTSWWDTAVQHGGKELSYLNLYDTEAAWRLVHELGTDEPAVAIIKHANPCGVALAGDITTAYTRAHECDPVSAFGGIVAVNRPVPVSLAEAIAPVFTEVIVAPAYEAGALEVLGARKNLRVLEAPPPGHDALDLRSIDGGLLVQQVDRFVSARSSWRVAGSIAPTNEQWRDLELAWMVCAHVKSNTIVLVADGQAVGIGAGQQNRVDAARIAADKAAGRAKGGAAASDAFFPFRDGLDACAAAGVAAVIEPGGSMRDDEVIAAADEHGIALVFTGERHFPALSAISLDGAALLAKVKAELAAEVEDLRSHGITPGLGTILVGDNPTSAAYVRLKHQDCAELGIASFGEQLPADVTQAEVLDVIARFNADGRVDAFLVQVPLPKGLDEEAALLAVDPTKDVDGLHPVNLGRLVMGSPGPIPCTPAGILELLVHHGVPIEGRHVVIIGRGLTIGRPLALLLALKRPNCNAAVTVVHTGVKNLVDHTRRADILVAAAGTPGLVTPDMVKPGAAVVGAGVTMDGKRIISDVVDEVAEVAGWMTPHVGGVGPMTRAGLLRNCVRAAKRRA